MCLQKKTQDENAYTIRYYVARSLEVSLKRDVKAFQVLSVGLFEWTKYCKSKVVA